MKEAAICPNCDTPFHRVTTVSHYDSPIVVERCRTCGGVWIDARELYKIGEDETKKFQELDKKLLEGTLDGVEIKEFLRCPIDDTLLVHPSHTMFTGGPGLIVEICPTCHGVWFNHGEFVAFKKEQSSKKKIESVKDSSTIQGVKKLLNLHHSSNWDNKKHLGSLLSTRVKGGRLGTSASLLPALLNTLREVSQSQRSFDNETSLDMPKSIMPAMEKYLPDYVPGGNRVTHDYIYKLNQTYREKKLKYIKIGIASIVFIAMLLFSFFQIIMKIKRGAFPNV